MITSRQLAFGLLRTTQEHPKKIDELMHNFVAYCRMYHLFNLMPLVVRYLRIEQQRQARAQTVTIAFAHEHGKDITSRLKRTFAINEGALEHSEQDQELLGGFIMQYRDVVWDGSVRGQLEKMKKDLSRE